MQMRYQLRHSPVALSQSIGCSSVALGNAENLTEAGNGSRNRVRWYRSGQAVRL